MEHHPRWPSSPCRPWWRNENHRHPQLALVALVGASGSGKSTFARRHFKPTEVLSSDFFRGLVSDDENDQAATGDAFDALYYLLTKRLARGRLTVVDATNVRPEDRKRLISRMRQYHCFAIAIVMNASEKTCLERNRNRPTEVVPGPRTWSVANLAILNVGPAAWSVRGSATFTS